MARCGKTTSHCHAVKAQHGHALAQCQHNVCELGCTRILMTALNDLLLVERWQVTCSSVHGWLTPPQVRQSSETLLSRGIAQRLKDR
eukprot:5309298-Amphidinium_carterae.1